MQVTLLGVELLMTSTTSRASVCREWVTADWRIMTTLSMLVVPL